MSLSVSHINVPENYNFSVKLKNNENILNLIQKYYNEKRIYCFQNIYYASPQTGFYCWDGIDCWVYNQEKQGFIELYFKSLEEYNLLISLMNLKAKKADDKVQNKLFRYDPRQGIWTCVESYYLFDESNLIGYQHYFKTIEAEISSHKKNQMLLKSIGEFKSLNYLLYGIPGTGKTTLIKSLSSKYNMDIYIVNSIYAKSSNIGNLLNPVKNSTKSVLLLFEDFDRFIVKEDNKELMGLILNAMDGFDDSGNTIRFFTGNDCDVIFQEKSLINRITGRYKFGYPTFEMFRTKLLKLNSITTNSFDEEKLNKFISLIVDKHITLRPFTSYCLRYLFNENNLDYMIENVNSLIEGA
jgi:predicted AAA+ superfamily ATPase